MRNIVLFFTLTLFCLGCGESGPSGSSGMQHDHECISVWLADVGDGLNDPIRVYDANDC
jgi:hypothetical protein